MTSDNKAKISYLKEYMDIVKEYNNIIEFYNAIDFEKIYELQAQIISGMPICVNPGDNIGKKVASHSPGGWFDEIAGERAGKLYQKIKNIEAIINDLPESGQRLLMRKRYMQGILWEQICIDMNYSWKQIHRIHSKALQNIKIE